MEDELEGKQTDSDNVAQIGLNSLLCCLIVQSAWSGGGNVCRCGIFQYSDDCAQMFHSATQFLSCQ